MHLLRLLALWTTVAALVVAFVCAASPWQSMGWPAQDAGYWLFGHADTDGERTTVTTLTDLDGPGQAWMGWGVATFLAALALLATAALLLAWGAAYPQGIASWTSVLLGMAALLLFVAPWLFQVGATRSAESWWYEAESVSMAKGSVFAFVGSVLAMLALALCNKAWFAEQGGGPRPAGVAPPSGPGAATGVTGPQPSNEPPQ